MKKAFGIVILFICMVLFGFITGLNAGEESAVENVEVNEQGVAYVGGWTFGLRAGDETEGFGDIIVPLWQHDSGMLFYDLFLLTGRFHAKTYAKLHCFINFVKHDRWNFYIEI